MSLKFSLMGRDAKVLERHGRQHATPEIDYPVITWITLACSGNPLPVEGEEAEAEQLEQITLTIFG